MTFPTISDIIARNFGIFGMSKTQIAREIFFKFEHLSRKSVVGKIQEALQTSWNNASTYYSKINQNRTAHAKTLQNKSEGISPTMPIPTPKAKAVEEQGLITHFTRPVVQALGDEVEQALAAMAELYGIDIRVIGKTYTGSSFANIKLSLAIKDSDKGIPMDENAANFVRRAHIYGLKPEDLGKTFTSAGGRKYKIVGLKPRNRKYPVLAVWEDGDKRTYKFGAKTVASYLKGII